MQVFTTAFLVLLSSTVVWSQALTGRIVDATTGEPVPFAHVTLGKTVSVSNVEGVFAINPTSNADSVLEVSFVGYTPARININRFSIKQIQLRESALNLDAVTVWTGQRLMHEVHKHTIVNYQMEAQRMTSYYKERLLGNDSLYYLAEGIMEVFEPSNVSTDEVQISPLRTRRKVQQKLDPQQITLISGSAFDMVRSSIWRSNSFLSRENIGNYEFEYMGKMAYGEREVYRVMFFPKNEKGYISGDIYIEEESFAIVKLVYEPQVEKSYFWEWVRWTEEFKPIEGNYQLTHVSFEGRWIEMGVEYFYQAQLINNNFIRSHPSYQHDATITKKDIFVNKAGDDFSEAFWEGFNFLKLTDSETQMSNEE